jgi:hypothetical protein
VKSDCSENALVLAAARRMICPAGSPPLGTIRSLAYFLPVIEEVLRLSVSPSNFQHLRHKNGSSGFRRSPWVLFDFLSHEEHAVVGHTEKMVPRQIRTADLLVRS